MASVSIIIPVLNRAQYLPRLFRSIACVDYEDLEVVLVDNGSTDGSLSLCRSFAEDAPMVVRVLEEARPGACQARNHGLAQCQTEWVYFFDSDDELSAIFLQEVMPRATGDYDLIAFPTRLEQEGRLRTRAFVKSSSVSAQILSATLNTQGMLFRTDFLRAIGGWDARLAVWQDWELGVRALLAGPRMLWLDRRAYHTIHIHPDSITGPSMASRREERNLTLDVVAGQLNTAAAHRALYLRRCILNGMLEREGTRPLLLGRSIGWCIRLYGTLLQHYTALGGRGAWRLANIVC